MFPAHTLHKGTARHGAKLLVPAMSWVLSSMAPQSTITGSTPGKIRTFLLDHERLLIVLIAAVLIYVGYVKVTNIIADHDAAQLKQAQVVANQQATQNVALAQQVAADAANLQALQSKLEAQNAQLVAANATLANALANRQKTDASLPLPDLAVRWNQLVPLANVSATNSGVALGSGGAVATVQSLERVPVLTEQLKNETTAKQNEEQLLTASGKNIADLNSQVGGLQKLIIDNDNVCKEQIKVVKDEARKSKRKWFFIGFVSGFISRQFISKGL